MNIIRNNVESPYTYFAESGRFIAQRNNNIKETMLRVTMSPTGESVIFWLSDEELDILATILREAYETRNIKIK